MIGSRPADEEAIGLPPADAPAAVAAFLRDHPERVRSVARQLQDSERLFESCITGHSMGRQLPAGAPVRIQLSRREHYVPGEVVAFQNGARLIAHRVLFCGTAGRRRGIVITRGDALLTPDLPFHVSAILGAVVAVQTQRGWGPPAALPRRALVERSLARGWQAFASGLCLPGLAFARRSLGWLYFAGRTAQRALGGFR